MGRMGLSDNVLRKYFNYRVMRMQDDMSYDRITSKRDAKKVSEVRKRDQEKKSKWKQGERGSTR